VDILLVEDHGESRTTFARLLSHWGHTVAIAGTLREADTLLKETPYDVLLSDIGLPDGEAFQLVGRAKEAHRVKRAMAVTGRERPEDRELSLRAGFDYYLTKPVDFHELRNLLAQL
jgi:DNA-binding response OmpR family regulator